MSGPPAVNVDLRHDGVERGFPLVLPSARAGVRLPLVVELHGRGIDPRSFDRWTGLGDLAAEARFALALPGAIGGIWNDGRFARWATGGPDDVGYLAEVIHRSIASGTVDPARVFVVGMSNGAAMAGRVAMERPELVAGVVQVAGTAAETLMSRLPSRPGPPLLHIHGTTDRFAPYQGGRAHGALARLLMAGRGNAGPSVGVDAWAEHWVVANGLSDPPVTERLPPDVTVRRWRRSGAESDRLVFVQILGGGHTWPGNRAWTPAFFGRTTRTFDATRMAWEFLSAAAGPG